MGAGRVADSDMPTFPQLLDLFTSADKALNDHNSISLQFDEWFAQDAG